MKPNTIFIIGATASGKSATAIKLARELNGVIINADSMQIYRGVDVITAVPDADEQSQAPHRMYSFLDPSKTFDVIRWRNMVLDEIELALADNKLPILCGGTGLYATAFFDGISEIPSISQSVRGGVRALQDTMTVDELYDLLECEDPIMANRLKIKDPQRIGRALEVIRETGNSLAYYQDIPPVKIPDHIKPMLVAVMPDRQKIYDNINKRFETMIDCGGLDEVRNLIDMGIDKNSQIGKAIGIRQLWDYLDNTVDKEMAIENSKTASRRYAKRQLTYINNQLKPDVIISDGDVSEIYKFIDDIK